MSPLGQINNKKKDHVKKTLKTYNFEFWTKPHCSKFATINEWPIDHMNISYNTNYKLYIYIYIYIYIYEGIEPFKLPTTS